LLLFNKMQSNITRRKVRKRLRYVQNIAARRGLDLVIIKHYEYICTVNHAKKLSNKNVVVKLVAIFVSIVLSSCWINSILTGRCLLSSNYLVWEATRPIADCTYCKNVTKPIILWNVTKRNFAVRPIFLLCTSLLLPIMFLIFKL
jgi:hypothetical protein